MGLVYSVGGNLISFPHDFPVGSTPVNVVVTDIHGNTDACYFVVIVEDEQSPFAACPTPLNPYAMDAGECNAS